MNTNKTMMVIAVSIIALSASAYAAEDHKGHDHDRRQGAAHAHESRAMHGGVVSVIKDMNYELVAKSTSIELYIMDHDKLVDVKNASVTVILLSAEGKQEVKLVPVGDNKLAVTGNFKTGAGIKALAAVTMPGQSQINARFALK